MKSLHCGTGLYRIGITLNDGLAPEGHQAIIQGSPILSIIYDNYLYIPFTVELAHYGIGITLNDGFGI